MKNKILIAVLLVFTLLVTGCGVSSSGGITGTQNNPKQEVLTCTRNVTLGGGVSMDLFYEVTYTGDYVDKIKTVEKVISDNVSVLEQYKDTIAQMYEPYLNIEFYENNIEISEDTLTSTTTIDYSKIDTDKLISIDSANATLIKDGKVSVATIKSAYESMGAICE